MDGDAARNVGIPGKPSSTDGVHGVAFKLIVYDPLQYRCCNFCPSLALVFSSGSVDRSFQLRHKCGSSS
jgi:hypothetical protein